jgi:hypothetical protein
LSESLTAFRCATAARRRADPVVGSAPQARGWLLLEHPGPWPVDAVAGSGIEPRILQSLQQAASAAGARILLVRRPGRLQRDAARRWILTRPGRPTVAGPWREDEELRAAAAALAGAPTAADTAPPAEALILVCAHGMHDACCAIRGRPVAAALVEHYPDQVWECSHVGGDRFAPNVVLLPDGFYYGKLDPETAVEAVRDHLSGTVDARWLRGMANLPPPVQAAAAAAYDRLGPLAPGAVTVESVDQVGAHDGHGSETTVLLRAGGARRVRVEVLATRRPVAQLTCRAARETPATAYQVVSFVQLSG